MVHSGIPLCRSPPEVGELSKNTEIVQFPRLFDETNYPKRRHNESRRHSARRLRPFLNGRPASGVGHMVLCPKCQGTYPIVQGSSQYTIEGCAVALDGMKTACGAALIASQQEFLASE
ncbi:PAAR domain-containing protein [Burkholderia cenocepacia]